MSSDSHFNILDSIEVIYDFYIPVNTSTNESKDHWNTPSIASIANITGARSTTSVSDGVNVYSFALHPEQHEPSGTINVSYIDNPVKTLYFTPEVPRGVNVYSFAISDQYQPSGTENRSYIGSPVTTLNYMALGDQKVKYENRPYRIYDTVNKFKSNTLSSFDYDKIKKDIKKKSNTYSLYRLSNP